jgi:hypothetical protein
MWVLQLNPMTANAERVVPVAGADTREALEAFLNLQLAPEPYKDGNWYKVFRQGGTLEWFNPPLGDESFIGVPAFVNVGTEDDWAREAVERFGALRRELYLV